MNKNLIVVLVIVVIIVGAFFALPEKPTTIVGSVNQANEYQSTTTRTFNGTALGTGTILNLDSGALGSVVITGAAAGIINLYDATSTRTNLELGTTTLVTIPASTAAGTYTFDLIYKRGLVYEFIGTAPTTTITWR